jgi:hypothetical protein
VAILLAEATTGDPAIRHLVFTFLDSSPLFKSDHGSVSSLPMIDASTNTRRVSMTTPTPTKLSTHLAKFRYESAVSPKREPTSEPLLTHRTPIKRKREPDIKEEGTLLPVVTPQKTRKIKQNRTYASPETYAHLKAVPDLLRPGLKLVFCGIK